MPQSDEQGVVLRSQDGRARVEFRWRDDRFTHRVLLDDREVASSIEGDASDLWPHSPPMQQLSLESISGSDAVLGVGSAGRTHWSLSSQFELHGDRIVVNFEWAARCRDVPEFLGATYQLGPAVELVSSQGETVQRDDIAASDGASKASCFQIGPDSLDSDHGETSNAKTYCWSYRLQEKV